MNTYRMSSIGDLCKIALLAFMSMIGFELFLHAGMLAPLHSNSGSFLFPPEVTLRRIPFAYLSFAFTVAALLWLMARLHIRNARDGFVFALLLGLLMWGAQTLGLFSISTANPGLLFGRFLGQSAEMGIAGMVIGSGLGRRQLRSSLTTVTVVFLITVILAVLLQNLNSLASS